MADFRDCGQDFGRFSGLRLMVGRRVGGGKGGLSEADQDFGEIFGILMRRGGGGKGRLRRGNNWGCTHVHKPSSLLAPMAI